MLQFVLSYWIELFYECVNSPFFIFNLRHFILLIRVYFFIFYHFIKQPYLQHICLLLLSRTYIHYSASKLAWSNHGMFSHFVFYYRTSLSLKSPPKLAWTPTATVTIIRVNLSLLLITQLLSLKSLRYLRPQYR